MPIATLASIITKTRKLIGLPNPFQISDATIEDYINSFYLYDLPAQFRSLKLKDVLTFNTTAGLDTYAFDSEHYTTVEQPVRCAKREIAYFNDPWSFYGANFNWQNQDFFANGNNTTGPYSGFTTAHPIIRSVNNIPLIDQNITNIQIDFPIVGQTRINFDDNAITVGQTVTFSDITGTIAPFINGINFLVAQSSPNSIVINLVSTGLTYLGGGETFVIPQNFNYPASRVQNILITANVALGNTLNVTDDGFGNLIGDISTSDIQGQINYSTGQVTGLFFSQAVPAGQQIQIQYNPTVVNIPLAMLFFQNQFTLRPVPDRGYTIEIVAYRQPSQALSATPNQQGKPELSEWWELIAIGAAKKYYEDNVDFENIGLMNELLKQRYALAETRTYGQLGKQRVNTLFADQLQYGFGNGGFGFGSGTN